MIIAGIVFRSLFIVALALGVLWSSLPADRGFVALNSLPTPDLIRVGLGMGICLVVLVQVFIRPRDEGAYKTWAYIGVACVSVLLGIVVIKALVDGAIPSPRELADWANGPVR
jgi:hypothetical protein